MAWARFANWIQLQLPILSYGDFQVSLYKDLILKIAFWVTVIAVAILLSMIVYIGASQWNKLPAVQTVTTITAFALTSGFQVFFPVAFYLLFTPWLCDPQSQNLYVIPSTQCFGSDNIISIIFGTMSVFTLFGLAFFSAFIKSSVEPVNNDFTVLLLFMG